MSNVYDYLPPGSALGQKALKGEDFTWRLMPKYQLETPDEVRKVIHAYRRKERAVHEMLIIEYKRTGFFNQDGAEMLQFHAVAGRIAAEQS